MDQPFPLHLLRPTAPSQPPDSPLATPTGSFSAGATASLIGCLAATSRTLAGTPYDPALWLSRAKTLRDLGYPELALADAWKAGLLCNHLLAKLDGNSLGGGRWLLGKEMGFWMLADIYESSPGDIRPLLGRIKDETNAIERQLLPWDGALQDRGAWYVPQPYPWLEAKHARREPEVAQQINAELQCGSAQRPDGAGAWLECRACVFPTVNDRAADSDISDEDALGLFTACDIPANTLILRDQSDIFGCVGPDRVKSHLRKALAPLCLKEGHPELPSDLPSGNLTASLSLATSNSALSDPLATLLLTRALLSSIQANGPNVSPLSHGSLARLKAVYHALQPRSFTLADLTTPLIFLQSLGIDIFAPPTSDLFAPWVLLTLSARLDNNAWSSPTSLCLGGLFCMLNHSCEANARWVQDKDGCRSLGVWTKRAVREGEEVSVEYDEFAGLLGVGERRSRLGRWIEGGCGCVRCVREGTAALRGADDTAEANSEALRTTASGLMSEDGLAWRDDADVVTSLSIYW
ncbi:hypothetical protein B0A48_04307 [Cryoendolithus antarcticus]|uniref:Histone-lysine N-methyltransferase SET5 n=1 Tax=Cryoendolithus antarcticus TaxID=1507870 RepID=A0A1V8TFG0_9PEZI|nr:hypothetical protein B0A48_04307 [Cryoendolithus antarcticus]